MHEGNKRLKRQAFEYNLRKFFCKMKQIYFYVYFMKEERRAGFGRNRLYKTILLIP